MSWSSETQITNGLSLASTTTFGNASSSVSLNPGESAEVQISSAFASGATADLYYRVVASNDGTRWDNVAYTAGSIGKVVSTTQIRTFRVSGVKNFRIEYAQSASDASAMIINAYAIKDGISI